MPSPFLPFPVLETARLTLRAPLDADAPRVLHIHSHPGITRYISRKPPASEEEALAFIHRIRRLAQEGRDLVWIIAQKETPALMIGNISLWQLSEDGTECRLGYELHPGFQRRGLIQEALDTVLDYGFATLGLQRISAWTRSSNTPSVSLLLKNGFAHDPAQEEKFREALGGYSIYARAREGSHS